MPSLVELLQNDTRPVIRGTAAWAIGKIGADGAVEALLQAKEKETDEQVVAEIEKGLQLLR